MSLDASYDDSRAEEALAHADHENYLARTSAELVANAPISFEEALSLINMRKQNLDHILQAHRNSILVKHHEEELERVLEILRRVRP